MRTPRKDHSRQYALVWRAMTAVQAEFGMFTGHLIAGLTDIAGVPEKVARGYFAYLQEMSVIERCGTSRLTYRITNSGEAPPMPVSAQARDRAFEAVMWNAMRTLRCFRPSEIAVVASTDVACISTAAAVSYCKALARAEYLATIDRNTYQLLAGSNTGPRAPMVIRTGNHRSIFDFNLMRTVNVTGRRTIVRAA